MHKVPWSFESLFLNGCPHRSPQLPLWTDRCWGPSRHLGKPGLVAGCCHGARTHGRLPPPAGSPPGGRGGGGEGGAFFTSRASWGAQAESKHVFVDLFIVRVLWRVFFDPEMYSSVESTFLVVIWELRAGGRNVRFVLVQMYLVLFLEIVMDVYFYMRCVLSFLKEKSSSVICVLCCGPLYFVFTC